MHRTYGALDESEWKLGGAVVSDTTENGGIVSNGGIEIEG